jgi:hypothetical protein
MCFFSLVLCYIVALTPLSAAHNHLDFSPLPCFREECNQYSHVTTAHYQKRSSPRLLNQIPFNEYPNTAPYITQNIGLSPHIGAITQITFSNVYEVIVDDLDTGTFDQCYAECTDIIDQLRQKKVPCVIMHVQHGELNQTLGQKLLMVPVYKNDESETLYLFI